MLEWLLLWLRPPIPQTRFQRMLHLYRVRLEDLLCGEVYGNLGWTVCIQSSLGGFSIMYGVRGLQMKLRAVSSN
jgi:hypothetical protein